MTTVFTEIHELLTLQGAGKKNGRRVTESDLTSIKNAAVAARAGRIVWVGPQRRLPKEYLRRSKVVSLKGKTVLPAFTECHTHLVFAGQRSGEFELRNRGVSYQEIARRGGGILSTVRATRKASPEDLLKTAEERADRFIRQGVTTIEVKSGYGLRLKDELKILEVAKKIRKARIVTTYLGPHAKAPEEPSTGEYLKKILRRDLAAVSRSGAADRADVFIEEGFFSLSEGKAYLEKARELGLSMTVHADQLSRTGAGAMAAGLRAQSADHLVRVSADDIGRLANSETVAVLLPAADLYMKIDYPPARALLDAGAKVALATDFNPGTSPTQDLALIGLLARLEMKMTLPEVIAAYTLNAADALGLAGELGTVEVGKSCDLAVFGGDWNELFYHAGYMPVHSVWKAGRCLWRTR